MEIWETWLLMCLLLRCMLLRRNLLLILLLRVWLVLLTVALMLISSLKTQTGHDEVHLLLHHAECSLPIRRVPLGCSVCSIVKVVIVVTSRWPSAVLVDVVLRVVLLVLLLGTTA